jgi:hypothetical protein
MKRGLLKMDNIQESNIQSTILILGNGFDLKCGLMSSYCDFLKVRQKQKSKFYKTLRKHLGVIASYDYNVTPSSPNANFKSISSNYAFSVMEDINIWEMIFTCNSFENELTNEIKWSDIEKEIQDFLVLKNGASKAEELYQLMQDLSRNQLLIWEDNEESRKLQLIAVIALTILKQRNVTRLLDVFTVQTRKVKTKNANEYLFYKYLLGELNRLETDFGNYLYGEFQKKDEIYKKDARRLFKKITNEEIDGTFVMNFNFTLPFEKRSVNNVHGSLISKGKKLDIIFGIDITREKEDKVDLEFDKYAYLFSKTFRKLSHESLAKSMKLPLNETLSKIVFYGHSLGEGDYAYFQSLFDFYDLYTGHITLEFMYSNYLDKNKDEVEFEEKEKVTKLLDNYGTTLTNKNWGRNMTHKLLLEKRIKLSYIRFKSTQKKNDVNSIQSPQDHQEEE